MLVKCQDIRDIAGAEMSFREKFNFFPGDLKNASKLIKKCGDCEPSASSAGDGIVGDKNFSLGEKIKFEENNPSFESILYWRQLYRSGLLKKQGFLVSLESFFGDEIYFPSFYGGGFMAVYLNKNETSKNAISPNLQGMEGNVIIMTSKDVLFGRAGLNDDGQQVLTPAEAASIERKMDDGKPTTGNIRGFGKPECFSKPYAAYNESVQEKACGLILKLPEK